MGKKWVTAFAAAPREARMGTEGVVGRTVRLETVINLTGDTVRLRFGNLFGETPVRIGSIVLWNGRSNAEITFDGISSLKLAPGHTIQSDEVYLPIRAGDQISVLIYFPAGEPAPHSASGVWQVAYSQPGDFTQQPDFIPDLSVTGKEQVPVGQPLPTLMDIEILSDENAYAIACFGDSITEMRLWTDPLEAHVRETMPETALLNLGIGGNRLLLPTGGKFFEMGGELFGLSGLKRMQWDLLEKSGIDTVILALGVNDVSQPGSGEFCPPVAERCTLETFAAGVSRVVLTLRKAGIRVIGCTITPFGRMPGCCEETLEIRREINNWLIRRTAAGELDGLIDFASAVADPQDTDRLLAEYDSGDHLHPSKLGGEQMAAAVAWANLL